MLLKTVAGISRKTLKRGSSLVESAKKSTNSARVCPFPHLFSLLQDMASAQSSVSEAELAICRLVEETSGHETFKYLGPGCLASFESVEFLHSFGTPNSNYFLVASNQVLTKSHLCAIEKQDKARSNRRKPSVKIVAEFPGSKDRGSLERKPLSDLYRSLEDDVFEFNGIIYVALTKLKKGSFLKRSLQVSSISELASNQLKCLVFCGERTRERNAVFSTRVYDLVLQFDSCLACDESRFSNYMYFLRSEEKKRFLKESEFEEGEKPLGAIIVSKDYQLAGFLNFFKNHPAPVLVASKFIIQLGKLVFVDELL